MDGAWQETMRPLFENTMDATGAPLRAIGRSGSTAPAALACPILV